MSMFYEGAAGPEILTLQQHLRAIGFNPGRLDGHFGPATKAAVRAFQASAGLLVDGVAGPRTLGALGLVRDMRLPSVLPYVTFGLVAELFPYTPRTHIHAHLPLVLQALAEYELTDKTMVLLALATIRAEAEDFVPRSEVPCPSNTSPAGALFDLYDYRRDLGNHGSGDGAYFKGRGFVQLTGRARYQRYSATLGLGGQLVADPEQANLPHIAARLLACVLHERERALKEAVLEQNLPSARRLVNGRREGLDRFIETVQRGTVLLTAKAVMQRLVKPVPAESMPEVAMAL